MRQQQSSAMLRQLAHEQRLLLQLVENPSFRKTPQCGGQTFETRRLTETRRRNQPQENQQFPFVDKARDELHSTDGLRLLTSCCWPSLLKRERNLWRKEPRVLSNPRLGQAARTCRCTRGPSFFRLCKDSSERFSMVSDVSREHVEAVACCIVREYLFRKSQQIAVSCCLGSAVLSDRQSSRPVGCPGYCECRLINSAVLHATQKHINFPLQTIDFAAKRIICVTAQVRVPQIL